LAAASFFRVMDEIIEAIRQELKANSDAKTRNSFQRFFKEKVTYYGVKTGIVNKIANKHWNEVKHLDKKTVFSRCEELLRSGFTEETFIVSSWLPNMIMQLELSDLSTFKSWIEHYIDNWAKCDGFCNHTIGGLIERQPEAVMELKKWAKSDNPWLKRAAAVSLIVPAKKGAFLNDALEISSILLSDKDEMVQKGYGWLLKEASRKHQREVLDYVLTKRKTMPRTALRYAIELMPKELRAKAMKKN